MWETNWSVFFFRRFKFQSVSTGSCLDGSDSTLFAKIITYKCHGFAGNQFFAFATSGQIVHAEEVCVGHRNETVVFVECSEQQKSQLWDYNSEVKIFENKQTKLNYFVLTFLYHFKIPQNQWIVHRETKLCMQNNKNMILLRTCNLTDSRFQWKYKSTWNGTVTSDNME